MRLDSRGGTIVDVNDGNVSRWSSEHFLAEATAWVADVASGAGIRLTGEREQPHVRPWSSAVRFGAAGGDLWFKVNAPGTSYEGALVTAIATAEPDLVPQVLAVDSDRGWSLTHDAGPVLRVGAPPDDLWRPWAQVLERYAEAQIRLAGQASRLLAIGVPEVSPSTLPELLRALVDELGQVAPAAGGLTAGEREKLEASYDDFDSWCAELASSGIPVSVQHDDVHSSNVCWHGSAASARLIDWGDTSWGFPLGTMLGTMNSIAWHARCERDDPRVLGVLDAYLGPFTRFAPREQLRRYVTLARRTGCVGKALSYRRSLEAEPVSTHRQEDFPVRGWLLELLEEP